MAGALYGYATQFIDPEVFNIHRMIFVLLIVVFGGLGNFWGPIAGTAILYFLFEAMRFLPLAPHILGPLRWILYSAVLMVIIIFKPAGIMGKKSFRKRL